MAKMYLSEAWLRREFLVKRKSVAVIASEQNVAEMTIRRYLEKFGLTK